MSALKHPVEGRARAIFEIEGRLRSLNLRHRSFFGGLTVTDERLKRVAAQHVSTLILGASVGLSYDKEILLLSLFPERHEAAFWASSVGRLLAWVGSAAEDPNAADPVPQAGAALALGLVKQRTSQMVTEGKLVRHPHGGVTRASLAERMREKWPVIPA